MNKLIVEIDGRQFNGTRVTVNPEDKYNPELVEIYTIEHGEIPKIFYQGRYQKAVWTTTDDGNPLIRVNSIDRINDL